MFDVYLHNANPVILQAVSPLVSLSVATTVSRDLDSPLMRQKVAWLEMAVHFLHVGMAGVLADHGENSRKVLEVTPKIMRLVISRCEHMSGNIRETSPGDPILKNLLQI